MPTGKEKYNLGKYQPKSKESGLREVSEEGGPNVWARVPGEGLKEIRNTESLG